ncbi:hypothetical protein PF005_g12417 [Phytophthora fragariae]|uniref:BZIP domain-containing protein n=2 Tax=Phytophthora TaxID=4783 RepID=A0A6A4DKQ1_9STRA|nr:hypothetical protein PF003_g10950 [Phytophthora fragariae]KAE8936428.1 hypothetical protein PF009_g13639 [Phytophthora fragariae]KAE9011240.1 hypothetical protein PF011_g9450 [Phytophthora fragariae]KAE9108010.1 hypothetical protein PF010_g12059 [Phytophthora fragariae]KAE9112592.1 hypothetical protein PF007_g11031 [Phytophthora fragariae]
MSFVLLEEDDSTVHEALAMIDAYEETPVMSELPNVDPIAKDLSRVKREQNRERDFRRRQRQKEERLQLQMQAQRLEKFLTQLRESGGNGASLSLESLADGQQQQVEAELLNTSLRKAVAAEVKWSKSLQSLLSKRRTMETVSLTSSMLSTSQSKPSSVIYCSPATLRDDPAAVRREIMATMDRVYYEAKATVNPLTGAAASIPELSCHYNVRIDAKAGPTTQLTSETPLECTLDSARELLSSVFSMPDAAEPSLKVRRTRAKRTYTEGEIEKEFSVDLGGSKVNECLDGVGLLRRHNEEDCELIIWAAISFHHSGKISFRECSWMAAARSAPSSDESVVRVNYRLNAEKAGGCSYIEGEHIDQVRNHALAAIGAKMKTKNHLLQKKMLVGTGRGDLASFLQYWNECDVLRSKG